MVDYKAIYKATEQFRDIRMKHWLEHDLFSFRWWLLMIFTIFPWFVWWKLVDKRRLFELVCFGSIIAVISLVLDAIGTVNLWWMYKTELLVQFPGLLVPDIVDIPIVYMLVYQYCSTWKSFILTMILVSVVFAFMIEPALRWIETYEPLEWEYFYSFLVYVLMAVIVRYIVLKMKKKVQV